MRHSTFVLLLVLLAALIGCGGGTKDRVTISEDVKPATLDALGASLLKATSMMEETDRLIRDKKIDEGLQKLAETYGYIHHINSSYLQLFNARAYVFQAMLVAEVKRYSDARDYLGKATSNLQAAMTAKGTSDEEKTKIGDVAKKISAIADVIEIDKAKKLPELKDSYLELNKAIDEIMKATEEKPTTKTEEKPKTETKK
jgi:hypothetical protein